MLELLNISTASVNQTPLHWNHNKENIINSIFNAHQQNSHLLLLPELTITGYGCEDLFFSPEVSEKAFTVLKDIVAETSMLDIIFCVGLPLMIEGQLYNGVAVCSKGNIHGIVCKQNLAKNGIHYEQRWFQSFPKDIQLKFKDIPVGDLIFEVEGIRFGFEICEDSWVPNRPARTLYERNVDVVLNPSASHFAIGKQATREQFVKEGSRAFGVVYAYANLMGCEAGRAIYDGGNMIASNGKIVQYGERLSFKPYSVYTVTVDISENKIPRINNSQTIHLKEDQEHLIKIEQKLFEKIYIESQNPTHGILLNSSVQQELIASISLGLWDWQCKTKQSGYVVSLSGGSDSAAVSSLVYVSHKMAFSELGDDNYLKSYPFKNMKELPVGFSIEEHVMPHVLFTAYQGSKNSGTVTYSAAKTLAESLHSTHYSIDISNVVEQYETLAESCIKKELTWKEHDVAKQNIQARSRNPFIWMIANIENKLLLTTSNLSESATGYCTMDGDTAGVLAPLGGLSKAYVKEINRFLCEDGFDYINGFIMIKGLKEVISQIPTAELRPEEQSDEVDLMPFPILDKIRSITQTEYKLPLSVLKKMNRIFPEYSLEQMAQFVEKYYKLYTRNQWKRERFAASFHLEQDSLDPKTYSRFPILNSGFEDEIKEMWKFIKP